MATISITIPAEIQDYVLEAICVERGYNGWALVQTPRRKPFEEATIADKVDFLCYFLEQQFEADTMSYERSKAADAASNERAVAITPFLVGAVQATVTP